MFLCIYLYFYIKCLFKIILCKHNTKSNNNCQFDINNNIISITNAKIKEKKKHRKQDKTKKNLNNKNLNFFLNRQKVD